MKLAPVPLQTEGAVGFRSVDWGILVAFSCIAAKFELPPALLCSSLSGRDPKPMQGYKQRRAMLLAQQRWRAEWEHVIKDVQMIGFGRIRSKLPGSASGAQQRSEMAKRLHKACLAAPFGFEQGLHF